MKNYMSKIISVVLVLITCFFIISGLMFYSVYIFSSAENGMISFAGYSACLISSENQNETKKHQLIISKQVPFTSLSANDNITVVTTSGQIINASYISPNDDLKGMVVSYYDKSYSFILFDYEIKSIYLNIFSSEFIGNILYAAGSSKNIFLISEGCAFLLILILLIITAARKPVKSNFEDNQPQRVSNIEELINIEKDIVFEKSTKKHPENIHKQ